MKKLKIFLTLTLILFLTACNVNQKKENVKTIEFWTLQLESFRPYLTKVIRKYESENPTVKIKWVDIPFSEGEKRTLAAVMSKNVPDLVNLNPDFSATLATRKALLNINEYVDKSEIEKYIPATIENLTYNDNLFGIPWYLTTSVTYYNRRLTNGLELPTNYFDLKDFSQKVKDKYNVYAIMPTICENGNLLKILNKYDALDYENGKLNFENDKTEKILNLFKYLYQNDLIPRESVTQTHREALEQFMSGQTAILVSGTNFLSTIKENAPVVYTNLGIYEQLTSENGKSDFSMMNLIVPIKSKYPKEAIDFALYLTNDYNQLEFSSIAPVFPSRITALNSPYFWTRSDAPEEKVRSIGAKGLTNALTPISIQKEHSSLNEIVDLMTQKVLLNNKDVKMEIHYAQDQWNKL